MLDEPRTTPPTRWPRRVAAAALALAVAAGAAACGGTGEPSSGTGTTTVPAGGDPVTEVLGRVEAPEAPGFEQFLLRVTIPPGVELAPRHPSGLEVAHVEEGELAYTVVDGPARVARGGAGGPLEELVGPTEVVLRPGDTIYEWRETNHAAANRGEVPVILVVASLVEVGQPLAVRD